MPGNSRRKFDLKSDRHLRAETLRTEVTETLGSYKTLSDTTLKANILWEPDLCLEYLADVQLCMYKRYGH